MQVNYSNTVEKLNSFQSKVPVETATLSSSLYTEERPKQSSKFDSTKVHLEKEFTNNMTETIKRESFINDRKRNYNKEVSRKSVALEIMKGTAPMPKHLLYPQRATHDQILAMTGNLPNIDIESIKKY